jgi:ribonucleoside-diphosphate reductase alpha chain
MRDHAELNLANTIELPTDYQSFIHQSRYSRFLDTLGRRETWTETVDRYISNVVSPALFKAISFGEARELQNEIREAILNLEVMPSMRCMMAAGPGLDRSHVAGYNCSYTAVDHPRVFDEVLYILMCGTGVGFSVERKYVNMLPILPVGLQDYDVTIAVEDSKEGWADAYRQLIDELYRGNIPKWDVSAVRAAGERLKTFGGRASGPGPLVELFEHTIATFKHAESLNQNHLSPMQVHSIMCMIGSVVIVGGVRRSAMISLSDLDDPELRVAKSGDWWEDNPHFALANNSVAYDGTPERELFDEEWQSLIASKSGERGIFNRAAVQDKVAREGIRQVADFGTNPCSEITLLSGQFCNLTSVVARSNDTYANMDRKVRLASILGTIQATLTDFPYLRPKWKENTEKEALLGVSITGIMDSKLMGPTNAALEATLATLRETAVTTNRTYAKKLGINQAAAVTCVKPEGTSSQLNDSASGIHARHSPFYIRTVRGDNNDPLTHFMMDQGIPNEPCVMKPETTTVFSFPVKAPEEAITRNDMTAIEQLELWLTYQRYFTCHKPSITVSVGDDEWDEVGDWVYDHFSEMSGVSFLPRSDHTYAQAPYQDITEEEYNEAMLVFPTTIDWDVLALYERGDTTAGSQTLACSGDTCELVDF